MRIANSWCCAIHGCDAMNSSCSVFISQNMSAISNNFFVIEDKGTEINKNKGWICGWDDLSLGSGGNNDHIATHFFHNTQKCNSSSSKCELLEKCSYTYCTYLSFNFLPLYNIFWYDQFMSAHGFHGHLSSYQKLFTRLHLRQYGISFQNR